MTTYFVGNYYIIPVGGEVTGGVVTKYYYAGAQRVAMRKGTTLYYLLSDHLGSTSLTTDASGNVISELRYREASPWDTPWGEVRYNAGVTPTDYQFTGQYSHQSDFGLMFYNARYYDPALSRFASPDSIVPGNQGVQAWDRYAYTTNNPLRYTDPTGHKNCEEDGYNCPGDNYTPPGPCTICHILPPMCTKCHTTMITRPPTSNIPLIVWNIANPNNAITADDLYIASQSSVRATINGRVGLSGSYQFRSSYDLKGKIYNPSTLTKNYVQNSIKGVTSPSSFLINTGSAMLWNAYDYGWGEHAGEPMEDFWASVTVDVAVSIAVPVLTAITVGTVMLAIGVVALPAVAFVGDGAIMPFAIRDRDVAHDLVQYLLGHYPSTRLRQSGQRLGSTSIVIDVSENKNRRPSSPVFHLPQIRLT